MDPELSAELSEIARAIRAQLDWQLASGSLGLPRSTPADLARAVAEAEPAAATAEPQGRPAEPAGFPEKILVENKIKNRSS